MKNSFNNVSDDRAGRLFRRLSTVPAGAEVVAFLKQNNVSVVFDAKRTGTATSNITIEKLTNGKYECSGLEIILNPDLDDNNLVQALAHESQHIRHHVAGMGNPDFIADIQTSALLRRAQEADAQVKATEVIFQMRLRGDKGPLIAAAAAGYADVCEAYESVYRKDPAAVRNGTAQRAAFDAWFSNNERLAFYDTDTCGHQADVFASLLRKNPNHGLQVEQPGDADKWLANLGKLSSIGYMPESLDSQTYKRHIKANTTRPAAAKKTAAPSPD